MMRMTVLASGSKGNSTVISSSRTRILVDSRLSCRELLKRMALAKEDPAQLDAILITHEHIDHVSGIAVLARRLRIPVFITEPTHRAWVRMLTPRTTMTYAKWLDHIQKEKEARAAAVAGDPDDEVATELATEAASIAYIAAEASAIDSSLALTRSIYAGADPSQQEPNSPAEETRQAPAKADPAHLPAVEYF